MLKTNQRRTTSNTCCLPIFKTINDIIIHIQGALLQTMSVTAIQSNNNNNDNRRSNNKNIDLVRGKDDTTRKNKKKKFRNNNTHDDKSLTLSPSVAVHSRMCSAEELVPRQRRSSLKKRGSMTSELGSSALNKSVTFSSVAKVKRTLAIDDMTEEERSKTWIQNHEHRSIMEHCQRLVRRVDRLGTNALKNGQKLCTRGLEGHLRIRKQKKNMNRYLAADEVFAEQDEQLASGIYDDEAIASVYSSFTSACQVRALITAAQDRKDVEAYLSKQDDNLKVNAAAANIITKHDDETRIFQKKRVVSKAA